MFGWLDPESAVDVVRRFDEGQFVLSHYRGRAGQLAPVQAALYATAVRLGNFAGALSGYLRHATSPVRSGADWSEHSAEDTDLWEIEVIHRTEHSPGIAYRMIMAGSRLAPTFLSCSGSNPKAEIRYETLSFCRIQ
jgi:hypothetical protein